jgi:hypothetical protein
VADIDVLLLGAELGTGLPLVAQAVLVLSAGVLGYLLGRSGRRWTRAGLAVVLVLAAVTCCLTLVRCDHAMDDVRGRLEGRIPGPFLGQDRARNHLDLMKTRMTESGVLFAATVLGSGVGYTLGRRPRPARTP